MKAILVSILALTVTAKAAEPTLNDFWAGRAVFAVTGEALNTDTRSGLHFLSNVKQPDGRYLVYYIRNEDLPGTGLAYTRDWRTFTDVGTVLRSGPRGSWDDRMAAFADVWKDGATWHLAYEGAGSSSPGDCGYATSGDGVNWTKQGIILQHSGSGEQANNGTPSLLKVGETWYMFYHGFDGTDVRVFGAKGSSLLSLSRMNGGRPLVNTSASGWDAGTVGKRSIILRDGYYWMVYEGSTDKVGDSFERSRWSSGIARSTDLLNWEKWQGTGGPVLPVVNGFGNDGPEWVITPDGKLNICFRKAGNTTGRAVLGWNTTPAQEWLFQAESQLYHQIGRRDAEGWSATTSLDGSGYLTYGPYTTSITPGACSALWRLLIDNNTAFGGTDIVATLDIFDANANRILNSRNLRRGDFPQANVYQLFALTFTAQAGQRLEFRLHWKDRAYIRQDFLRVR